MAAMASSEASWTSMLTFALKVSAPCHPSKQSVWGDGWAASKLIIRASALPCFLLRSVSSPAATPTLTSLLWGPIKHHQILPHFFRPPYFPSFHSLRAGMIRLPNTSLTADCLALKTTPNQQNYCDSNAIDGGTESLGNLPKNIKQGSLVPVAVFLTTTLCHVIQTESYRKFLTYK